MGQVDTRVKRSLSPEHRAAISRGQIERHRRAREQVQAEPTHKRCTKCGEIKPLTEFLKKKRTLATGEVRRYPAGECRPCTNARRKAWMERKRAELGPEGITELYRRWNANRDPEQRKIYQREYEAMRRRKMGMAVRGPWKKYRERPRDATVEREPIARWIEQNVGNNGGISLLALRMGIDERRIRSVVRGHDGKDPIVRVTVDFVDRVLLAVDAQDQWDEIYPLKSTA